MIHENQLFLAMQWGPQSSYIESVSPKSQSYPLRDDILKYSKSLTQLSSSHCFSSETSSHSFMFKTRETTEERIQRQFYVSLCRIVQRPNFILFTTRPIHIFDFTEQPDEHLNKITGWIPFHRSKYFISGDCKCNNSAFLTAGKVSI